MMTCIYKKTKDPRATTNAEKGKSNIITADREVK